MAADWFEELFGFEEHSPERVYERLSVRGETLISNENGENFGIGRLETPSLGELRARINPSGRGSIRVQNIVGDARELHQDQNNAGTLIQAASQFNLLEMISERVTPEMGVTRYQYDHTQGPACAISAGAATVYRNYFAPLGGQIGQTEQRQIDCLSGVHDTLAEGSERLWKMRNGYALPTNAQLERFNARFAPPDSPGRDGLRAALRIGLQWGVQTTQSEHRHRVSQAFCSAMPLSYMNCSSRQMDDFAQLILEAAYEATLLAAIENNAPVFLTSVGGGAFGNPAQWIHDAMQRAFDLYADSGLDVKIVNYQYIPELYNDLERPTPATE